MSGVVYRQTEDSDISAIAHIRASEWGEPEYWEQCIARYLKVVADSMKSGVASELLRLMAVWLAE